MPEVKKPGPLYRVTVTEYERGWGQRPVDVRYFTTEAEAVACCENINKDNTEPVAPDWYMAARYEKVA